jgi:fumarate reductase subunit D
MSNTMMLQREMGISSRVLAAMSYLGVLSLVPLVMNRDDSYVQFHARQGVVLWMWEVLAIYTLLVPGVGQFFFRITSIACLVLSVIGVVSVLLGRAWKFPIIGDWAARL